MSHIIRCPKLTNYGKRKIKHLEFIQNIINRMNLNSFQIKEWMIMIVSADSIYVGKDVTNDKVQGCLTLT